MQRFHLALQDLTVTDGVVHCLDGQPFDRVAYSHFKYGYLPPAKQYGRGLGALIADQLWLISAGRPIIIVSAPYKFLPTASHAIARYLCEDLSIRAFEQRIDLPVLLPFYKAEPGNSDYAKSDIAGRRETGATLGLQIDESHIPGSCVIVVDDIRITGTAEIASREHLEPLAPYAIWYVHAARLLETVGMANPSLENELNETVDHTPQVILEQLKNHEFELCTRVLRMMLEWPESKLSYFLSHASFDILELMLQAAEGSGRDYCEQHHASLQLLNWELWQRSSHATTMQSDISC